MEPPRLTSSDVAQSIRMAVAVCIEARRLVDQAADGLAAARYQRSLSRRLLTILKNRASRP